MDLHPPFGWYQIIILVTACSIVKTEYILGKAVIQRLVVVVVVKMISMFMKELNTYRCEMSSFLFSVSLCAGYCVTETQHVDVINQCPGSFPPLP